MVRGNELASSSKSVIRLRRAFCVLVCHGALTASPIVLYGQQYESSWTTRSGSSNVAADQRSKAWQSPTRPEPQAAQPSFRAYDARLTSSNGSEFANNPAGNNSAGNNPAGNNAAVSNPAKSSAALNDLPASNNRSGNSQPEPFYWAKPDFVIPFNVGTQGKMPAAVELEVSTDQGKNWTLVQRAELTQRQFAFRSRGDGLYWFRIKTIDANNRAQDTSAQPMAVMIDTARPEIDLVVDSDEQARMTADFRLADANLSGTQMRLEYQTELDANWVPVQMQTQFGRDATEIVGKGVWEVPIRARQIVVRLLVRDLAGNEAEVTRLPSLLRTANSGGGLQLASGKPSAIFQQFFGGEEDKPAEGPSLTSPQAASELAANSSTPRRERGYYEELAPPPLANQSRSDAQPKNATQLSIGSGSQPVNNANNTASPDGRYVLNRMEESPAPAFPAQPNSTQPNPTQPNPTQPSLAESGNSSGNFQSNYPAPTNFPNPVAATTPAAPAPTTLGPALRADPPFASNSRAFSLDYAVETDPGNQISAVELWGTTDGGKSWSAWGNDPDRRSPFDIQVQADGLFGFRMVVVGSNGLANHRPLPGDNADAWIQVDTKLPFARINSASYGSGTEAGSLVIEYSADDEQLAERPIALSYSQLPQGPWTTIEMALPNSARYLWPGNPNLPRRVYLKIEAHDRAGNVFADTMELPVDLEGLAPRGRIRGFHPIAVPK